jgi:hypothetical protein
MNTRDEKRTGLCIPGVDPKDVTIGPVRSRADLEGAFRLLYKNYLRCGYCESSETGMLVPAFALLPETVTFVAKHLDEVVSTVSLIPDSPFRFPIDEIFSPELDRLRTAGRRLAEVGMLADRREFSPRRLGHLLKLYRLIIRYSQQRLDMQDLCFAVHPHHAAFYEKYFLAKPQGETRYFPEVKNNPAVFMLMRLEEFLPEQVRNERIRKFFFEETISPEAFDDPYRMTEQDVADFLRSSPAGGAMNQPLLDWLASKPSHPQTDGG